MTLKGVPPLLQDTFQPPAAASCFTKPAREAEHANHRDVNTTIPPIESEHRTSAWVWS